MQPRYPPRRHIPPDDRAALRAELAEAYRAGATVRELAKTYGLSYGRTNRLLAGLDMKKRARGPRRKAPPSDQ